MVGYSFIGLLLFCFHSVNAMLRVKLPSNDVVPLVFQKREISLFELFQMLPKDCKPSEIDFSKCELCDLTALPKEFYLKHLTIEQLEAIHKQDLYDSLPMNRLSWIDIREGKFDTNVTVDYHSTMSEESKKLSTSSSSIDHERSNNSPTGDYWSDPAAFFSLGGEEEGDDTVILPPKIETSSPMMPKTAACTNNVPWLPSETREGSLNLDLNGVPDCQPPKTPSPTQIHLKKVPNRNSSKSIVANPSRKRPEAKSMSFNTRHGNGELIFSFDG